MSYDDMTMSQCVRHQVEISHLKERAHRRRLIVLPGGPNAHRRQSRKNGGIWFEKEAIATSCGPSRQLISAGLDFIANFLGAEDSTSSV